MYSIAVKEFLKFSAVVLSKLNSGVVNEVGE
jgi:hypothetical protein